MTAASKSTNKRACNNALFRVKERAGDTVVLCILLGGVLLFILWPMLCIALRSFRAADGGFTLEAYSNVLSRVQDLAFPVEEFGQAFREVPQVFRGRIDVNVHCGVFSAAKVRTRGVRR